MASTERLVARFLLLALGACSRTGLALDDVGGGDGGEHPGDNGGVSPDDGGSPFAPDGGPTPLDAALRDDDLCLSAVSGPNAILGNCSTRDGRSRVLAPSSPHVTWTTKLPVDSAGYIGPGGLSADSSGHVYVVNTDELPNPSVAAIWKVDAKSGTIDWTQPIDPSGATRQAVILSAGPIDLLAYGTASAPAFFAFAPGTGTSTSTTFGLEPFEPTPDSAVGADGSLYFNYETEETDGGVSVPHDYVTRVLPDGTVKWRSVDLRALDAFPPMPTLDPGDIALGHNDLVVAIDRVFADTTEVSVANAFDPSTGGALWGATILGSLSGSPVVRPDGSIAAVFGNGTSSSYVIFDASDGTPSVHPLSFQALAICAVTRGGVALIEGNDENDGESELVAVAADGSVVWTRPGVLDATIAIDGTIVGRGGMVMSGGISIVGLDGSTGSIEWQISPPVPGPTIWYATLTSEGTIVAEEADGTLFGASD